MNATEQQQYDSDTIFMQITTGDFSSFEEAQTVIAHFYVPDGSVSRAGISHALKRLERHFKEETT